MLLAKSLFILTSWSCTYLPTRKSFKSRFGFAGNNKKVTNDLCLDQIELYLLDLRCNCTAVLKRHNNIVLGRWLLKEMIAVGTRRRFRQNIMNSLTRTKRAFLNLWQVNTLKLWSVFSCRDPSFIYLYLQRGFNGASATVAFYELSIGRLPTYLPTAKVLKITRYLAAFLGLANLPQIFGHFTPTKFYKMFISTYLLLTVNFHHP